MLFNSTEFLAFAVIVTASVFLLSRLNQGYAKFSLIVFSFSFISYFEAFYGLLLLFSVGFNYAVGSIAQRTQSKLILGIVILFNLLVLGHYKYLDFFLDLGSFVPQSGAGLWASGSFVIPLGISFYTFQQIAYQVDAFRDRRNHLPFFDYVLFISFFPQLIAGPIVRHSEFSRAISLPSAFSITSRNLFIGLSIFAIGLFKKVVIADELSLLSKPIFDAAASGQELYAFEAWLGVLAYSFQIYFDFSGYCDMAIGIARILGIRLPINFNAPYKSRSIVEFWRRWHITLSRFLRDYLYIPLGGNKLGVSRRYLNILITMLLGGLWHGAGWGFVAWGAMHGALISLNHAWVSVGSRYGFRRVLDGSTIYSLIACACTFMLVSIAWVFFRSETWDGAVAMLIAISGMNGAGLPSTMVPYGLPVVGDVIRWLDPRTVTQNDLIVYAGREDLILIVVVGMIAFLLPTSQQITRIASSDIWAKSGAARRLFRAFAWPGPGFSVYVGAILAIGVVWLNRASEFLYFSF